MSASIDKVVLRFESRSSSVIPEPLAAVNTIAIVGGGFSGTVLAANLLRNPPSSPTRILLIERNTTIGCGLAYAAYDYPYLLNVTANKMSASSHEPLEFLEFARRILPNASVDDYLPRALYGKYLQAVLQDAEHAAPNHVLLTRINGEVTRITRLHDNMSYQLELREGRTVDAGKVILALGNPPPAALPELSSLASHPAYIENPWSILRRFTAQQKVLIVGTGLTMTDALLRLTEHEQQMPTVYAISRHGLLPTPATGACTLLTSDVTAQVESLLWVATSTRRLLASVRQLIDRVTASGGDWRDLISAIRDIAPRLWQRMPVVERQRFVRHLQCYWDVCRHRLPMRVSEHLAYVRAAGKLHVHAGRIKSVSIAGRQLRVRWRPRGEKESCEMTFDAVINATGPNYNLNRARDPLLQSLQGDGLAISDALGLGLQTGPYGAVMSADGSIDSNLFYLGPMLRAAHWESTSVSELREHAEQLSILLATECNV